MPIARFEMPDGRIARFEVPEGTTPEQAQAMIQQHLSAPKTEMRQGPRPGEHHPAESMGGFEKFMRAGGNVFRDAAISAEQMIGRDKTAMVERNRVLDAPINQSGAGMAGRLAGSAALVMSPGAAVRAGGYLAKAPAVTRAGARMMTPTTLTGAGAQGAALGALTPTGEKDSRILNTAAGFGGGFVGQYFGNQLLKAAGHTPDALSWVARQAGRVPALKEGAHKVADKLDDFGRKIRTPDTRPATVGSDSPAAAAERLRVQQTAERLGFPLTYGDAKATPDITKAGNLYQRIEAQLAQLPGSSRYFQLNQEQKNAAIAAEVKRLIDGGFRIDKPGAKWTADSDFFKEMAAIPKTVSKHLGDRDAQRALSEVSGFGAPRAVAPASGQRMIGAIDTETDDIVTAIRKLGGISKSSTQGDWNGLEFVGNPRFGPVFRNDGGQGTDEIVSQLQHHGYLNPGDDWSALWDKLADASRGTGSQDSLFSAFRQFKESETPLDITLKRLTERLDTPQAAPGEPTRLFKPGEQIPLAGKSPIDMDNYVALRSNLGKKAFEAGEFSPSGSVYKQATNAFDNAAQRQHPELDLPRQRQNYQIEKMLEPALDTATGNYDLNKIARIVNKPGNREAIANLGERGQALIDLATMSKYVKTPSDSGTAANQLALKIATGGAGGAGAGAGMGAYLTEGNDPQDYIRNAIYGGAVGGLGGRYIAPAVINRIMQGQVSPLLGREALKVPGLLREPLLGASRLFPTAGLLYENQ